MSGAVVYLDQDVAVTTVTDAAGQFELADVPAGAVAWIQVAPDEVSAGTFHGVAVSKRGGGVPCSLASS